MSTDAAGARPAGPGMRRPGMWRPGIRRPRSLRSRVALGVTAIVVVGQLVAGTVGVLALSAHLRSRTDAQLSTGASAVAAGLAERPDALLREQRLRVLLDAGVRDGRVHLLHDGAVVATITADGRSVPQPGPADVARLGDQPRWLAPDVRAVRLAAPGLEVELEDGTRLAVDGVVLARDTSADTATVRRTAAVAALTGLLVTAGTVALAWWAVGSGLAPLRRMARDAERIAAGETDLRLGSPATALAETAGLASALDQALDSRASAERRVRDFVADAAHELRTPLTSVHGWADLYLQGALDADGVDRAMERIGDATTRMRRLVEEMALLARLDADVPLTRAPVDLGALVDDAVADLDVLAPGRPLTWRRPDAPVVVAGDRERLAQVVGNLVGNVLRHTPADAGLTVRLRAADGTAVLEVHDDGPGVPVEVAPRAFERFVRQSAAGAGPEHAGERTGSGLGLAIVAAVARAHGGGVALDSAPGRGTTVEVRLPLA